MRPSISSPMLLAVALLLPGCDSPPKEAPPPVAKTTPPSLVPIEVKEPAAPIEPAVPPAEPATPTAAATAPAAAADAAPSVEPPSIAAAPEAKTHRPSSPEASTARKAGEGRPASAFTDCRGSETFADGRCYASREAACEALSCAGTCIDMRSMPPQVSCGRASAG